MTTYRRRPGIDRRTVLRGGAVGAAALLVAGAATGCQRGENTSQLSADRLVPLVGTARDQQRAAQDLAPRLTAYSAALLRVAQERGEHAEALANEIKRLYPAAADQLASGSAAATAPTATPPTATPTTATSESGGAPDAELQRLREGLRDAAATATEVAAGESGYAAGLLASIAAACTVAEEVQLA